MIDNLPTTLPDQHVFEPACILSFSSCQSFSIFTFTVCPTLLPQTQYLSRSRLLLTVLVLLGLCAPTIDLDPFFPSSPLPLFPNTSFTRFDALKLNPSFSLHSPSINSSPRLPPHRHRSSKSKNKRFELYLVSNFSFPFSCALLLLSHPPGRPASLHQIQYNRSGLRVPHSKHIKPRLILFHFLYSTKTPHLTFLFLCPLLTPLPKNEKLSIFDSRTLSSMRSPLISIPTLPPVPLSGIFPFSPPLNLAIVPICMV